jgi:hypothetical protein
MALATTDQIKTLLSSDADTDTKVKQVKQWVDDANTEGYDEGFAEGREEAESENEE